MTPKRRIIPVFVPHLGCPNCCVFCNQRTISGKLKPAEPIDVIQTIENARSFLPHNAAAELAFYGGSFTAIPEKLQIMLLSACSPYLKSGFLSAIRISTRPDAITRDSLALLSDFNVSVIEIGAQSMDDDVLKASGRGHDSSAVVNAATLISASGFSLVIQMMTGLPSDTELRALTTAQKIAALSPDAVRIYPAVILSGSELYDLWQCGAYPEHTLEDAVQICAKLLPVFIAANIPVIRLGLNPSDELSAGFAAAGSYHPAFGELVYSRFMLHKARQLLIKNSARHNDTVILGVHKSRVSSMVGHRKENVKRLTTEFHLNSIKVSAVETGYWDIILLT